MRYLLVLTLLASSTAYAEFTLDDNGNTLRIRENGQPVLIYNYALVDPPAKVPVKPAKTDVPKAQQDNGAQKFVTVPESFRRGCYIHPLYGLDGEVLTEDFPVDHFHHRGVFWAWPNSTLGDKEINVWEMKASRQHHEQFLTKTGGEKAEVAVQNRWSFDTEPNAAKIRENVRFVVWPAQGNTRAIDFTIKVENVSQDDFIMRGATTANKGYGGFCIRPDSNRAPMIFTDCKGAVKEDLLRDETPWADISFAVAPGEKRVSGMAIFQNAKNPGYPYPGWILRHYGFLGASWPHTEPKTLKPGESFELQYRLLIHRGSAEDANVKDAFQQYANQK